MSRPKSPLVPQLRDYVSWQIKYYPENRKQLEQLKTDMIPSAIPKYEKKEGGGGFNSEQRPTEDIAFRIISDEYIMQMSFTVNAIESVIIHLSEEDKELLHLTYWNGQLTPDGIAMRLNMSRRTYYNRLNDIIYAVAKRMGIVE